MRDKILLIKEAYLNPWFYFDPLPFFVFIGALLGLSVVLIVAGILFNPHVFALGVLLLAYLAIYSLHMERRLKSYDGLDH